MSPPVPKAPLAEGAPAEAPEDARLGLSPEVLARLAENRTRFLTFLERRPGRRDLAEELLQDAFVRGLNHGPLRDEGSAVAWFYRLLRNALVDHHRRVGAERRALHAAAHEPPLRESDTDDELLRTVCDCVSSLVSTLKPSYAEALRRVDLEGTQVSDYAGAAGISAGNAAVRLHRARQALRRRVEESCGTCAVHGCWDCQCQGEPH